jgi:hypothetical protein
MIGASGRSRRRACHPAKERCMPGDVLLSDTNFYAVRDNQPVLLTITIGNNQAGGSALRLNGKSVPVNPLGPTQIGGDTQNLKGSVLHCVTTVKDINPLTNRTSVVHDLEGGVVAETFPYEISVKEDKGLARYFITYVFA